MEYLSQKVQKVAQEDKGTMNPAHRTQRAEEDRETVNHSNRPGNGDPGGGCGCGHECRTSLVGTVCYKMDRDLPIRRMGGGGQRFKASLGDLVSETSLCSAQLKRLGVQVSDRTLPRVQSTE